MISYSFWENKILCIHRIKVIYKVQEVFHSDQGIKYKISFPKEFPGERTMNHEVMIHLEIYSDLGQVHVK